jgi:hypothetical protein
VAISHRPWSIVCVSARRKCGVMDVFLADIGANESWSFHVCVEEYWRMTTATDDYRFPPEDLQSVCARSVT